MDKLIKKINVKYKEVLSKYLDKILHFLVCFFFTTLLIHIVTKEMAFVIVLAIGLLKELYDKKVGGSCDANDVIADILGATIAIL